MPYTVNDLPDNLPSTFSQSQINTFISAANASLERGEDEGSAIAIGISSAEGVNKQNKDSEGDIVVRLSADDIQVKGNEAATKSLVFSLLHTLTSFLGKEDDEEVSKGEVKVESEQRIVKFNDEQMVAIEPLYTLPMESDLHGEGMTREEIEKMVDNINTNITKITGNIGHAMDTDGFYFTKAWVNQCDCYIGDELVPEGQPIIKVQFTDEKLWKFRKEGKLQGLSIGALGKRVDNPEYSEDN